MNWEWLPEEETWRRVMEIFNCAEGFLWMIAAAVALARARRWNPRQARNARVAAAAFVAFGVSDWIEVRTGAWWNPPALFFLKAICLGTLAVCWWRQRCFREDRVKTEGGR